MRWLFMVILFVMALGCGSTTETTHSQTTTAKDSVVVKERIIVRQGVNLETIVNQPCDSLGNLKPFKQTLRDKGVSISVESKEDTLVATVKLDSLISTQKEVIKQSDKTSDRQEVIVKTKTKNNKFVLWSAIILWIYIAYRVARIAYPPLRFLPK